MTELAYMVREDWAKRGTTQEAQSTLTRDWVGPSPFPIVVTNVDDFSRGGHDADAEAARFIAPTKIGPIINIGYLLEPRPHHKVIGSAVVIHPSKPDQLESIRQVVEEDRVGKLFVMVWSRSDKVLTWLDALGAVNLDTHKSMPASDPLVLAAAELIRDEDYNGLSSGAGKSAVVQLVRAFAAKGYPARTDLWLYAYFARGGSFHHAETIAKLVNEIDGGTKHRVTKLYADNIVEILREQLQTGGSHTSQELSAPDNPPV